MTSSGTNPSSVDINLRYRNRSAGTGFSKGPQTENWTRKIIQSLFGLWQTEWSSQLSSSSFLLSSFYQEDLETQGDQEDLEVDPEPEFQHQEQFELEFQPQEQFEQEFQHQEQFEQEFQHQEQFKPEFQHQE